MTADQPRLRVTTNLAFGICLILLGTVLILDRLQILAAAQLLRLWPIALVLVGLAMVVQSFQGGDAAASARGDMRLGHVVFWVFIAAIFWNGLPNDGIVRSDSSVSERPSVVALLGRHRQISSTPRFRGAEVTSIMGRADLDLRKTTVAAGDEPAIEVFTVMGASTIRVPEGWHVDVRAMPVLGGVRDRREGPRDAAGAPRIVIRGFVMLGGLEIRS